MKIIKTITITLSVLFTIPCTFAQSSTFFPEQLKSLIESKAVQQAYWTAKDHLEEWEGNPTFDLYYGIAAVDTGHANEGVFALQRVVLQQPNNLRARLELARAYFALGEYRRAKSEFEYVLSKNPPENVKKNVALFMDAIEEREKRFSTNRTLYADVHIGHDSNVNSGPSDSTITISDSSFGSITANLSDDSVENSDSFKEATFGGSIRHPVNPNTALFAKLDGSYRFYSSMDEYDTGIATAQLGATWKPNNQHKLTFQYVGQKYYLNEVRYRDMSGFGIEWAANVGTRGQVLTGLSRFGLFFPDQELRSADLTTASVTGIYLYGGPYQSVLFASLYNSTEDAQREDSAQAELLANRGYYGGRFGIQLNPINDLSVTASLMSQKLSYQEKDIVFNIERDETYSALDISVGYPLTEHWSVKGNVNYATNDSTIDLYDYERTQAKVGVRYDY